MVIWGIYMFSRENMKWKGIGIQQKSTHEDVSDENSRKYKP